jgi:hypothetical protein
MDATRHSMHMQTAKAMATHQGKEYGEDAQDCAKCPQVLPTELVIQQPYLTLPSVGIMQLVHQVTDTIRHIVSTIVRVPESDSMDCISGSPSRFCRDGHENSGSEQHRLLYTNTGDS